MSYRNHIPAKSWSYVFIFLPILSFAQFKHSEGGFEYQKDEIIFKGKKLSPGDKLKLGSCEDRFWNIKIFGVTIGEQELPATFSNTEVEYLEVRKNPFMKDAVPILKLNNGKKAYIKSLFEAFLYGELIIPGLDPLEGQHPPIFPIKDGKMLFEKVDSSLSESKSVLYKRARLWVSEYFKDSKRVIQSDDAANGDIFCKGVFKTEYSGQYVNFNLKINCRDNRYRIQVYSFDILLPDLVNTRPLETYPVNTYPKNLLAIDVFKQVNSMIEDISKSLSAKSDTF